MSAHNPLLMNNTNPHSGTASAYPIHNILDGDDDEAEPLAEGDMDIPRYQPALHHQHSNDPEQDKLLSERELSIDGTQLSASTQNTAGIFGSYVNLTNSIIGSGILGLPYAFASAGWILGYILIVAAACSTTLSLHLLAICSTKVTPPASFYRVTEATIPQFTFLVDAAVASMCFGVGVSYLIVIGGLMPDVCDFFGAASSPWLHREIWVILGFAVVAPISCFKTLDALKYTSAAAIFFVAFIACLIVVYASDPNLPPCDDDGHPNDDTACVGSMKSIVFNIDTMRVLGVFVFAYSCQMNIFPVVNELKRPTIRRFDRVIYLSIGTACSLYCIVAGAGYATYGDAVESNILISYPNTATTSVARIFVSLLVAFSYPLLCNPGRNSMMSLWALQDKEGAPLSAAAEQFRFMVTTAIFLLGSFGVAMVLDDLGVVLALIGATGSTVITFILPGAAYYVMHPEGSGPEWKRQGGKALFVAGCLIMPICLAFIFV